MSVILGVCPVNFDLDPRKQRCFSSVPIESSIPHEIMPKENVYEKLKLYNSAELPELTVFVHGLPGRSSEDIEISNRLNPHVLVCDINYDADIINAKHKIFVGFDYNCFGGRKYVVKHSEFTILIDDDLVRSTLSCAHYCRPTSYQQRMAAEITVKSLVLSFINKIK